MAYEPENMDGDIQSTAEKTKGALGNAARNGADYAYKNSGAKDWVDNKVNNFGNSIKSKFGRGAGEVASSAGDAVGAAGEAASAAREAASAAEGAAGAAGGVAGNLGKVAGVLGKAKDVMNALQDPGKFLKEQVMKKLWHFLLKTPIGKAILTKILVAILVVALLAFQMYLLSLVLGAITGFFDNLFSKETYIVKELEKLDSYEDMMKFGNTEKVADMFVFYQNEREDLVKAANDAKDKATTDEEKAAADAQLTEFEAENKEFSEKAGSAFNESDVASVTPDEIPIFLKMERQSYAWAYPTWDPVTGDVEKKIYNMYKEMIKNKNENSPRYIKLDLNVNPDKFTSSEDYKNYIVDEIYAYQDLPADDIFNAYKKTFEKNDVEIINKDDSFDDKEFTSEEKKEMLKEQFDAVYKEILKRYKKYFNIVQYCDKKYYDYNKDKFIKDKNQNYIKLMYYTEGDGSASVKDDNIYMRKSTISNFRNIDETVNMAYFSTDVSVNTGVNDNDLKLPSEYETVEGVQSKLNSRTDYTESRSYEDRLENFQRSEYTNRLNNYVINSILGEKELTEAEDGSSKEKGIDPFNVSATVLSGGLPYFEYVYPNKLSPLKEATTKANVAANLGDSSYDNFDIYSDTFNPFFPGQRDTNSEYTFTKTDYPNGYISIDQDKLTNSITDMQYTRIIDQTTVFVMYKDFVSAAKEMFSARNHRIVDVSDNISNYYVKHKLPNETQESIYDGYFDSFELKRRKEVITTVDKTPNFSKKNEFESTAQQYAQQYGQSTTETKYTEKTTTKTETVDYTDPPTTGSTGTDVIVTVSGPTVGPNVLIANRTVTRKLPTLKLTQKSNMLTHLTYNYEVSENAASMSQGSIETTASDDDKSYVEIITTTHSKEDEDGNVVDSYQTVKEIYHKRYVKMWSGDFPSKSVTQVP